MSISQIDAVLLFDIDLSRRRRIPDLRELIDTGSKSSTYDRYIESFEWLFEAQSTPGDKELRAKDPTRRFLSQEVNCPYSPDRFDRFGLVRDSNDVTDQGGVITISRTLKAAVLCIWKRYNSTTDPLEIKHSLSVDIPQHYLEQLSNVFDYIADGQLMYPSISIRYSSSDLAEVISRDGVFLGRLLSGGLDHEPDEILRQYLSENLSRRRYESLFLLSSGGVGIYSSGTEPTEEADLNLYENTLFRAVQVCKMCLLEQRLLRTFRNQADSDAKKVRIVPRPLLIEKRREELLVLENDMVKALPFRSTEAMPLVRKAQEIFQIPIFLQEAKDSYSFLESRYQNTKTTALAVLAVIVYIFDKLKIWERIGSLFGWH
jgi:hypothetical protein